MTDSTREARTVSVTDRPPAQDRVRLPRRPGPTSRSGSYFTVDRAGRRRPVDGDRSRGRDRDHHLRPAQRLRRGRPERRGRPGPVGARAAAGRAKRPRQRGALHRLPPAAVHRRRLRRRCRPRPRRPRPAEADPRGGLDPEGVQVGRHPGRRGGGRPQAQRRAGRDLRLRRRTVAAGQRGLVQEPAALGPGVPVVAGPRVGGGSAAARTRAALAGAG